MPPRNSLGGASPPNNRTPTKGGKELDESAARFDLVQEQLDEKLALAPLDQKKEVYRPGTPIKFYVSLNQSIIELSRGGRADSMQPFDQDEEVTLSCYETSRSYTDTQIRS